MDRTTVSSGAERKSLHLWRRSEPEPRSDRRSARHGRQERTGQRQLVDRQGVDVGGLGDAAYGVFNGGNATVSFSKGDAYASIGLGSSQIGASPQKDHAIALAKTAASRI